jgi:hypothetical protein
MKQSDDSEYRKWIKDKAQVEKSVDDAAAKLNKIGGDTNGGLTPDSIKFSPEYKRAKESFNKAFAALRLFNSKSPKKFVQRKREERLNKIKANMKLAERVLSLVTNKEK